jgi:hypothetical protein
MATGYNAESKQDLKEQYLSYKSVDFDDEETEKYYNRFSVNKVMELIKQDDFVIEESDKPFPDDENPNETQI